MTCHAASPPRPLTGITLLRQQLASVVLKYYLPQGAEVAVPAPPRGQVRVRGLHAGPRQDGLGGLECGDLASVQDSVQVNSRANTAADIDHLTFIQLCTSKLTSNILYKIVFVFAL